MGKAVMNYRQAIVAIRMLMDARLPLDYSDIFSEAVLDPRPGTPFTITDERLEILARFIPDLVVEYLEAGVCEDVPRGTEIPREGSHLEQDR